MNSVVLNGDCAEIMKSTSFADAVSGRQVVIVTDPPFNVGYHYRGYKDKKPEDEYYKWLAEIFGEYPLVCVHYPEGLHRLSIELREAPEKVVSWVYNSNTAKQHRDIGYYRIKPDFNRVKQPYKNPTDKRVQKLLESGRGGQGCTTGGTLTK